MSKYNSNILRENSKSHFIEGKFSLSDLQRISEDQKVPELFLFSNHLAFFTMQWFFRYLGPNGFQSKNLLLNGKLFENVTEVPFDKVIFWAIQIDVLSHPAIVKGSGPYPNEIFVVDRDHLKPFIDEIIEIENKYDK